jgi:hypothetical protein
MRFLVPALFRFRILSTPLLMGVGLLTLAACGGARTPAGGGQAAAAAAPEPRFTVPALRRSSPNLLQNPSFEHDWQQRAFGKQRRFLLLTHSDLGMGEADGYIDHWSLRNAPPLIWDGEVARTGSRSIRLEKGRGVEQRVRFAGEQHWRGGGAYYSEFLAMDKSLAEALPRRWLVAGAWVKTRDLPAGVEPQLTLTVHRGVRAGPDYGAPGPPTYAGLSVTFGSGTHDWEYKEVRVEAGRDGGTPYWGNVILITGGDRGAAWYDDVTLREEVEPTPNLLTNAGFEATDRAGWPESWGKAELWTWWRNPYYLFTGWSHSRDTDIRGGASLDPLLAYSGSHSLRLTVYPGDNLAVGSAPIQLSQDRARPLEVRAMVRGDRLRGMEIMAQDETGQWLPQGDFLGEDVENNADVYNMGTTGAGTYDWLAVRKYFSPRKPVKSIRLFLCARGFDGVIVERNEVGSVWFDDVQLFEHGGSRAAAPKQPAPAQARLPFRLLDVDPGDRLWGNNRVQARIDLPDNAAAQNVENASLDAQLIDPAGTSRTLPGKIAVVKQPGENAPGVAVASVDYRLEKLCKTWTEQYKLVLRFKAAGATVASTFPFGTPSRILTAGTSAFYAYPNESVSVYANLRVARDSFSELARCEVAGTVGGAPKKLLDLSDFGSLLRPQLAPNYIDTSRLVHAQVGVAGGAKPHPWDEPVRDCAVSVRLFAKGDPSKPLAESETLRFGFMQRVPQAQYPQVIRKTEVDSRGYILMNGEPFFPVYWTAHFGTSPEANYPPRFFGVKSLDVTPIVYSKKGPPDAGVKAGLQGYVRKFKDDPRLFQWEMGEGEMQLQDGSWRERAEWLKTAAAWIREVDPNHLINGPEAWLVGHPRHNDSLNAFIPHFDAIGVEASFEEVPKLTQYAKPLMAQKSTAVLVGLETYFYQSPEVLRWRGYKAVLEGAAGVGLCPSGMLQARPDRENFLRGLNGELRGLGPVITAVAPKDRITASVPVIQTMERVHGGKRYLFALRNKDTLGDVKARFAFPPGSRYSRVRAMFEGRTLTPSGDGFEDSFPTRMMARVYELSP